MKNKLYLALPAFSLILVFIPITLAQDYTQWHLPKGAKARLGRGSIGEITYSPDGTRLAVASSIGIQLYDTQTGEALALFTEHTSAFGSVAFSPLDGTILAAGSDGSIYLWDVGTGQHLQTLEGHTDWVSSVAFSPDGTLLVSGSKDKTIRIWDVKTGKHLGIYGEHKEWVHSVAFSPNGKLVASGSFDKTVHLWDAETGKQLRKLQKHTSWFIVSLLALWMAQYLPARVRTVPSTFGMSGQVNTCERLKDIQVMLIVCPLVPMARCSRAGVKTVA